MDHDRALGETPLECRGRSLATSLFGAAVLASAATASLGQTYYDSVAALHAAAVTPAPPYVVLGGYYDPGDGGGGTLLLGAAGCTSDGGLVFNDASGDCFYRADPTYSARDWGALCDVTEVNSSATFTAVWHPGTLSGGMTTPGTLVVPTVMMPQIPKAGQYIAISQIGGPTLWSNSLTSAHSAASLTRYSALGGTQSGYKVGDLISFQTDNNHPGSFSQQVAITVDAVDSGGTITQWHFVWGGVYDAGDLPAPTSGALIQDDTRSVCGNVCGTLTGQAGGATMVPAWSGWSVLNSQTISSGGSGYSVGNTVTLSASGGVVYRSPKLIVEATASGSVTAFDWVDYGSFCTLPANPTTLTATGGGLTLGAVAWTRGPFATTIASVTSVSGSTSIVLTDSPPAPYAYPYPYTLTVQSLYFGDDDYSAINSALLAKTPHHLVIPAGCGTTQPLNLTQDSSATSANPALEGGNPKSSGIYAFAYPLALRKPGTPGVSQPVLSQLLYAGLQNPTGNGFLPAAGGGFRDLFVEGFGIPQGYGYHGLANGVMPPSGYKGPSAIPYLIPTAGTAVEIDAASLMFIDNVHIADGGIGAGNSAFQCGLTESDPAGTISGATAQITFANSRIDANPAFAAGPTSPDFALRVAAGCRGSVFRNLTANDGIKADVLQYDANTLSQIRVDSDAIGAAVANAPGPGVTGPAINWATFASFGLAGAADYGVYVRGATSLSQTVCGIANTACVVTIPKSATGALGAGHITDTQMRCGAFTSVPSGYLAVELGAGAVATTVSGTASTARCAVPPAQLVVLDDPSDATSASVSLCNNANAPIAGCTGYQGPFAAGQVYTQPVTSYGSIGVSTGTLYAVPFYSPASGGAITRLGIDVVGTAATCEVGVYNAANGVPTTLIADGGTLSGTGTLVTTGAFSAPVRLAPQTLYFLAVGCDAATSLQGARNGIGALNTTLTGAANYTSNSTQVTAPWSFVAHGLPATFANGATITSASGSVPGVFAGP